MIERLENGPADFQLPNDKIAQSLNSLQGSFEQRNRNPQGDRGEDREEEHVSPDRGEAGFLQQQTFEAVHRIREWVALRNRPQPRGKSLDGIDRTAGKEQERIENAEH